MHVHFRGARTTACAFSLRTSQCMCILTMHVHLRHARVVADSSAERSKRRRKHLADDHSDCHPSRCPAKAAGARSALSESGTDQAATEYGTATRSAADALAPLAFKPGDPRHLIAVTVIQLARQFDTMPTPGVAAEMRRQIEWLLMRADQEADAVDEIRATIARKHADALIDYALKIGRESDA
jgi:hypothetical protein